jgi:hypothetical protein
MRRFMDPELTEWEVWPAPSGERAQGPGRLIFQEVAAGPTRAREVELTREEREEWGSSAALASQGAVSQLLELLKRAKPMN